MPRKTKSGGSTRKKAASKRTKRSPAGTKGGARGKKKAEKIFYKIGEVCQMTDTEPYVLRYWESEFPNLAPSKNRSGQRIYAQEDVDMVLRIKELLYEEGYTIAGARRKLEEDGASGPEGAAASNGDGEALRALKGRVRQIRDGLQQVLDLLS